MSGKNNADLTRAVVLFYSFEALLRKAGVQK